MNRFDSVRDAKEYLVRRILEQAHRNRVPLSDVEQKMLYFSETGWTLPDLTAISREFDEKYDQDEYEGKIGQIIRRIVDQPDTDRDEWNEAVQRLREEDHYLLVLIDAAASGSEKTSRWEIAKYLLAGGVVALVFLRVGFFVLSHIENRAISSLLIEGAGLGLAVLAAILVTRGWRKSA